MRSRIIAGVATLTTFGTFAACGSDSAIAVDPTPTVTYISQLNSANERPNPNASTATGTATYTLKGNTLSFVITVTGLTGPATASHIHVGAASASGGVIVPFVTGSVQSGNLTAGTIDLTSTISNGTSTITGDSLKVLLNNGNAYTNVHTSANGGGEIRGQIIKQ
ncbi:CHRD domain-containing protein [soil metagenome]